MSQPATKSKTANPASRSMDPAPSRLESASSRAGPKKTRPMKTMEVSNDPCWPYKDTKCFNYCTVVQTEGIGGITRELSRQKLIINHRSCLFKLPQKQTRVHVTHSFSAFRSLLPTSQWFWWTSHEASYETARRGQEDPSRQKPPEMADDRNWRR